MGFSFAFAVTAPANGTAAAAATSVRLLMACIDVSLKELRRAPSQRGRITYPVRA
jgi:hypothetical protein